MYNTFDYVKVAVFLTKSKFPLVEMRFENQICIIQLYITCNAFIFMRVFVFLKKKTLSELTGFANGLRFHFILKQGTVGS